MKNANLPKVLFIGGPDVDSRIPIIKHLTEEFSISVLGSNPDLADTFLRAGISYFSYALNRGVHPLADISTMIFLTGFISRFRPDIVHTFDTKPAVWGRLAAKIAGVPIVIGTITGLGALYSKNNLKTRIVRSIYKPLQKLACRLSNMTIFQNTEDVEQFIRDGIVAREKTAVVFGSGVETQVFAPEKFPPAERSLTRESLNLNEGDIIVTMISRLIRSKGVIEFARAAQIIRRQHPQTVFLLAGSDDKESVDRLTAPERDLVINAVTWLGARNDIPKLLAISDIFVLPTYYREGIPRVLLEAASMELPIITTQVPGCVEVVTHNLNGFLVPIHDGAFLLKYIDKLIMDHSFRKQFGQESRRLAISRFDISIITAQTASIYKKILMGTQNGN
jgi:glycosyltransferase involved in cell wall biosynthesis